MKGKAKAAEFMGEDYKIHVTGRDVLVTESMKNYVIEKLAKLEKFSMRIVDIVVIMDVQKLDHHIDIVMKVDHIKIKSEANSTDMYASIDKAVDKLIAQLRKYKSKIQQHTAKGLSVIDLKVNVMQRPEDQELNEINMDIEDENRQSLMDSYTAHKIVSQETKPLKILAVDEAVMKMELSGDSFLLFRSEEDSKLKLIYRRKDRNFGIIELDV